MTDLNREAGIDLNTLYQWILIFFIFALWAKLIMDKEKIAKIKGYLNIKLKKKNK